MSRHHHHHGASQSNSAQHGVGSLEVRHLRDSILVPSALLFLEYAVLDDMATTWFLLLCSMLPPCEDVALDDMAAIWSLFLDWRGTNCQTMGWYGHKNAHLNLVSESTDLRVSSTRLLFATSRKALVKKQQCR